MATIIVNSIEQSYSYILYIKKINFNFHLLFNVLMSLLKDVQEKAKMKLPSKKDLLSKINTINTRNVQGD